MQMELYEAGVVIGTLSMDQSGLYQQCEVHCSPAQDGVSRVYLWHGEDCICLGVPIPQDGAYVLRRRMSAASLPFVPEQAVLGEAVEDWLPWRGRFLDQMIPHAYRMPGPAAELLLPAQAADSLPEALKALLQAYSMPDGTVWSLLTEPAEDDAGEIAEANDNRMAGEKDQPPAAEIKDSPALQAAVSAEDDAVLSAAEEPKNEAVLSVETKAGDDTAIPVEAELEGDTAIPVEAEPADEAVLPVEAERVEETAQLTAAEPETDRGRYHTEVSY